MKLPTKEQILKASESCPDAKDVLQELFPEAFEEEEREITEEIKWEMFEFDEGYWLMGNFGKAEDHQFYFNVSGFHFNHEDYEKEFRFEEDGDAFRIFKRGSK